MLFHAPELDPQELAALDRIEDLRRTLGFAVSALGAGSGSLRRLTFARAVQGSNSDRGLQRHGGRRDRGRRRGGGAAPGEPRTDAPGCRAGVPVDALTYVLQLVQQTRTSRYSDETLLRGLHFMMTQLRPRGGTRGAGGPGADVRPGTRRPGRRSSTRGRMAERVPGLDGRAGRRAESGPRRPAGSRRPGRAKAAMGHLNLVLIHPFS